MPIGRRRFLFGAIAGAAGLSSVLRSRSVLAAVQPEPHALSFYHIHTAETLKVVYRDELGELVTGALDEIRHFLRDFRNEQTHDIDVELLDRLNVLYAEFGRRGHFEVISGYRSARTNEALRHATDGVAKNSLHISGRAIDVRLTSAATDKLRDAAIALGAGGVGYYAESNFVHLDTGAVRTW